MKKVHEKYMSPEHALNFNQWKTFSENCKLMRVGLWLVYKGTKKSCGSGFLLSLFKLKRVYSNSKEVSYVF